MKTRSWLTFGGAIAAIAAVVILGGLLPVGRWAQVLVEKVHGAGAAGVALFAAIYIVSPLLLAPASVLTIAAGFLYGRVAGTLLVLLCALVAASLAFLLGRTLLRAPVRRRIERDPKLRAVDAAIGAHGVRLVLLLRLSPVVPFNLLNYALGATRVAFLPYAAASLIGMIPGTFLFVSIGAAATSAAQLDKGVRPPGAALWVGIAATLSAVALLTVIARRALREVLPAQAPPARVPRS